MRCEEHSTCAVLSARAWVEDALDFYTSLVSQAIANVFRDDLRRNVLDVFAAVLLNGPNKISNKGMDKMDRWSLKVLFVASKHARKFR